MSFTITATEFRCDNPKCPRDLIRFSNVRPGKYYCPHCGRTITPTGNHVVTVLGTP